MLFRSDRLSGIGGGVLLLIRASLQPVNVAVLPLSSSEKFNATWCRLSLSVGNILIGCVHRSPSSTTASDLELSTCINYACSLDNKYKLLMGDFTPAL